VNSQELREASAERCPESINRVVDSPKGRISVCIKPEAEVVAFAGKLRRPKDCSHEVVIEIGGPESELSLLQREKPIMVQGACRKTVKETGCV